MIRSVVLGLVVGAVFLTIALWGVPMGELGQALAQMHPVYLLHVTVLFVAQLVIRAYRQLLFIKPLAPATTFRRQLSILTIGFFCINTFPARLGEAVRPFLLYDREGVPLGAGFGQTFTERVLDTIGIFAGILGVILWVDLPDRQLELWGQSVSLIELGRTAALTVLPPILIVTFGLAAFGDPVLRTLGRCVDWAVAKAGEASLVARVGRTGLGFAESFVSGIRVLRSPWVLAGVLGSTVVVFLTMALVVVALAYAFDLEDYVGFGQSFALLGITMLAIAMPAPPGFAGVFEAAVRGGLALLGVYGGDLDARALAFALVFHWFTYLLYALSAGYFLWADGVSFGRLFRFARGGSDEPPADAPASESTGGP